MIHNSAGRTLAEGEQKGHGLYMLKGRQPWARYGLLACAAPSLLTWHKWLGHLGYSAAIDMARLGMAEGMLMDLSATPPLCEHCILSKQTKNPIPQAHEGKWEKAPLDIVYLDLMGPEDVPTLGGSKYVMNIIDDYSIFQWGFTLKKKSEVQQVFQGWKAWVEWETGHKVGLIRNNGGGEYSSATYEAILQKQGVEHQTTAPYMSVHNGKS